VPPTLANVARAANHMDAANVDALVSWSPASVRCLTGYWCWLAPLFREFMVSPGGSGELVQRNIALLPRSGDSCLVLEPMWALNTSATWVQDIRVAGGSQFVADADGCEPERVEALSDEIRAQTIARAVQEPVAQDPFEVLAQALRDRGMDAGRIGVEMDGACAADREALRRALPSAQLLVGQCATEAPCSASIASSASLGWTLWAKTLRLVTRPC